MNAIRGIILCAVVAGTAAAQGGAGAATWEGEGCADGAKNATVGRCGLTLSGDQLLRGWPASVVTIGGDLSPIPLSRYVRGDSALVYALRYEQQSRTGRLLRMTGGGILFAQSILIVSHTRNADGSDGRVNARTTTVVLSGLAVLVASAPFRFFAERNGERAVAAHNRSLSR